MQPNYSMGYTQGQYDWEHKQLDDNPYNLQTQYEFYSGWRDGWIAMNKQWNPSWYAARPKS